MILSARGVRVPSQNLSHPAHNIADRAHLLILALFGGKRKIMKRRILMPREPEETKTKWCQQDVSGEGMEETHNHRSHKSVSTRHVQTPTLPNSQTKALKHMISLFNEILFSVSLTVHSLSVQYILSNTTVEV